MKILEHFKKNILVYLLLALFFSIGFNSSVSKVVAVTQFSISNGAVNLSLPYAIAGGAFLVCATLITYLFTRISCLLVMISALLFFSAILFFGVFVSWYVTNFSTGHEVGYGFLFVSTKTIIELSESTMWLVPAAILPTQKIKKYFIYIAAAFKLGVLFGAMLVRTYAASMTAPEFLFLSACFMCAASVFVGIIYRYCWHIENEEEESDATLTEFLEFLNKSRYWIMIIMVEIFVLIAFFSCEYVFNVVSEYNFRDETSLLSYYGLFEFSETIASTLFSLLIYQVLMRKLGVWNTVNAIPAAFTVLFFTYFYFGTNIYLSTVIGILNVILVEYLLALMIIVYKAAVQRFGQLIISFSNTIGLFLGMFLAGLCGLILQLGLVDLETFTLIFTLVSAAITVFAYRAKSSYTLALSQGISVQQLQHIQEENYKLPMVQTAVMSLWKIEDPDAKTIGLQFPIKVDNPFLLRYFSKMLGSLKDPDPDVRINALRSCVRFSSIIDILEPVIIEKFEDPDPQVRLMALRVLAECGSEDLEQYENVIETLIDNPTKEIKEELAHTIGILNYSHYQYLLLEYLDDSNYEVRLASLRAVKQILIDEPEQFASLLILRLNEKEPKVADVIIHYLEELEEYVHPENLDLYTKDVWLWRNILKLLKVLECSEQKSPAQQSAIVNMYSLYEQVLCIEAIKKIQNNESIEILIEHLEEKNKVILQTAIDVAFYDMHGDDSQSKYVYRHLIHGKDNKKSNAIEMLEHLGSPSLVRVLSPYFEADKDNYLRRIREILAVTIHKWELVHVFEALLADNDEWTRACVVHAIGHIKGTVFLSTLKRLIEKDPSQIVRNNALYASYKITGELKEGVDMKELEQQALLIENVMFLKRTDLFRPLTLNELVVIIQNIELSEFESGEFLFSESSPLKGIYLIMTGSVELFKVDKEGKESRPISLKSKDTLGIVAYYEPAPHIKRAVATTLVKAFFISKENFSSIIEHYPRMQEGIVAELCKIIMRYE